MLTYTSTITVVFLPLAFIDGLVGSFVRPFAIPVSFTLIASLIVALTAVPVLDAILLRPGDLHGEAASTEEGAEIDETWMPKAYTPALLWALRHKLATIFGSLGITIGSLALVLIIPITLFPSGGERFLTINITIPPGTSLERTSAESETAEDLLAFIYAKSIPLHVCKGILNIPDAHVRGAKTAKDVKNMLGGACRRLIEGESCDPNELAHLLTDAMGSGPS